MENETQAGINSAMATAQLQQVQKQTDLLEAQRLKTEAEIPQVTTSTANVAQQTKNLEAQIPKISAEIHELTTRKDLQFQQGLTEGHKRNLMTAQENLAEIEKHLRQGTLTLTEAQTKTQNILTRLKELELPEATAFADFYLSEVGKASPYVDMGTKAVGSIVNSATKLRGRR